MLHANKLRIALVAIGTGVASLTVAAAPELDKAVVSGQSAPKGMSVLEAKSKAKDAEKVVVAGRVKDFVDGQAVFTITDAGLKSCKETGDNCPTPWDYCCHSKAEITSGSATVKLVGEAGGKQAIKGEVKGLKGIDHLTPIVAEGTAQKDKRGNLVILASQVYVGK